MEEGRGRGSYWIQTLGCPKNQVDSAKLAGQLLSEGYREAAALDEADLVVVNTCAFIEAARQESIDAILETADRRSAGSRLVVTGCLAERYGDQLAEALPEVDLVAGFGVPLAPPTRRIGPRRDQAPVPVSTAASFDLLELPPAPSPAPWAYVKVAEGCDRRCGFCAIPSFRGRQRSRPMTSILDEVSLLAEGRGGQPVKEIVLVAQDLASYGRDRGTAPGDGSQRPTVRAEAGQPILELTRAVARLVPRTRLLYLYPSGLTPALVDTMLATGVPYFDLSLQHVSRPLLARMRRWGDGDRFLRRIEGIRRLDPQATFRSSFILGYPGETEGDHDRLLAFLAEARLDWAGFFLFSPEEGTYAEGLDDQVAPELALERLRECGELQDAITAARRDELVGQRRRVLVDEPGRARSVHEAPEIDGTIRVPETLETGSLVEVRLTASLGTDLVGVPE